MVKEYVHKEEEEVKVGLTEEEMLGKNERNVIK